MLAAAGARVFEPYLGTNQKTENRMGAPAAIAVIRMKEREVRDAFRDARAMNPASAMSLEAIGIAESAALNRLKRRAVIREAGPGLFYFDEDVWQAVRGMRRRMALLLLVSMLIVLLVFLYGKATVQ